MLLAVDVNELLDHVWHKHIFFPLILVLYVLFVSAVFYQCLCQDFPKLPAAISLTNIT